MVAGAGTAPASQAFQASANLSQLPSDVSIFFDSTIFCQRVNGYFRPPFTLILIRLIADSPQRFLAVTPKV